MKFIPWILLGIGLLLLAGCAPGRVVNPEFEACMRACAATRNNCMVDATSADDINRCNEAQSQCALACESGHERYIEAD